MTRLIVVMFLVDLMVLGAGAVSGQTYPNKPMRIVAGAPGGQGDRASRLIVAGLTESLGQQVIVDNRGSIAGEFVFKALPDGYTLLIDSVSLWLAPLLQATAYDPVRDFSPVTLISTSPSVLVVPPSLPANSVKELIALAKAKPGDLNFGSAGTGSSSHLAAELFNAMAGVKIVHVPFKGAAPALTALIGGEVQLVTTSAGSAMPHVRSGRVRALAVTSLQPSALAPGLPTVAASGVPGYEVTAPVALFAPAKTPEAIIDRLSRESARILNRADVKERFFNSGSEARGSSPQELAAIRKPDRANWGKLIKDEAIRAE